MLASKISVRRNKNVLALLACAKLHPKKEKACVPAKRGFDSRDGPLMSSCVKADD